MCHEWVACNTRRYTVSLRSVQKGVTCIPECHAYSVRITALSDESSSDFGLSDGENVMVMLGEGGCFLFLAMENSNPPDRLVDWLSVLGWDFPDRAVTHKRQTSHLTGIERQSAKHRYPSDMSCCAF